MKNEGILFPGQSPIAPDENTVFLKSGYLNAIYVHRMVHRFHLILVILFNPFLYFPHHGSMAMQTATGRKTKEFFLLMALHYHILFH